MHLADHMRSMSRVVETPGLSVCVRYLLNKYIKSSSKVGKIAENNFIPKMTVYRIRGTKFEMSRFEIKRYIV
jgi:hypothetical protein